MNAARRFVAKRKQAVDPLDGLTPAMRDAIEQATKSMLVFGDAGEVRSIAHFSHIVCSAATARALLGRGFFAPVGDGDCIRLTRTGLRAAAISVERRARFARFRAQRKTEEIEGRAFLERLAERRRAQSTAAVEPNTRDERALDC